MSYMEQRSTFTTYFFLFLILTLPYFSRGGSRSEALDSSDMYEIDYRGPETHSSVPPPDHSHGKATGLMGSRAIKGDKVKKVHG